MQRIPIKFAAAGMVLVKSVSQANGMVLVGEGVELTDSIISRLKNAGVPSLTVQGCPMPNMPSDLSLSKALERMPHLFRKYQEDPLMKSMRGMVEQVLRKAVAREEKERKAEMQKQLADVPVSGDN